MNMNMADNNNLQPLCYLEGELEPSGGEQFTEDPELAAIKARVLELEEEEEREERLEQQQQHCEAADMQILSSSPQPGLFYTMTHEERIDADNRSVYVGNVDYGATADELEIHFNGCGPVNRVTILCDRFSGHPKGFAYIEFTDSDSVPSAVGLDETLFRGRVLKVMPKRTNMPGISTTDRGGPRGGGRARGGGAGASVRPATTTTFRAASGTSRPGRSTKCPTRTTEAPRWARDSGATWTTASRRPSATRAFSSSPPLRRSRGPADSTTTPSSASGTAWRYYYHRRGARTLSGHL